MAEEKRNPTAHSKRHPGPAKPVVLMTGASGFLGKLLSKALAAEYVVVGLDRESGLLAHAECVRCDITSDDSVGDALREVKSCYGERIASVVHLAGYYDFSGEPNPLYQQVNVEGTRRLLRELQALQVEQFIYASTILVHAPTEPGMPINETSPLAPRWAYPQSKLETENVVAHAHGAIPYVLLRIAGVYTGAVQPPTLAHQISWIDERQLKGRVFPGETSHGQSFMHIDDLVEAVVRTIRGRDSLPPDLKLLLGEPTTLSYAALQNRLGTLIHGEQWETETVPKSLAKLGARLQGKLEAVVPDSIDRGEKPFIKPFMVELADDHYELDVARAQELLGWAPRHALREELPAIVAALKADPLAWYQANRIPAPEWLETITEHPAAAHTLLEKYERSVRLQHAQNLWAHFLNLGLGLWLITSPPILGYPDGPMTLSNIASGALVMLFSLLSLSRHMAWARFANAMVGVWLLFAPLVFWAPTAAGYLNDTLDGALVIGLSLLVRPAPGVGVAARTTGPDVPPGWNYSPSTWTQRVPIIALAFVGLYISRYLAAPLRGRARDAAAAVCRRGAGDRRTRDPLGRREGGRTQARPPADRTAKFEDLRSHGLHRCGARTDRGRRREEGGGPGNRRAGRGGRRCANHRPDGSAAPKPRQEGRRTRRGAPGGHPQAAQEGGHVPPRRRPQGGEEVAPRVADASVWGAHGREAAAPATQHHPWSHSGRLRHPGPRGAFLFSFQDLIVLRTAWALTQAKLPPRRIIRSLKQLRIVAVGDRVAVQEGDARWQADSGQYLLALEVGLADGVLNVTDLREAEKARAEDWFSRGAVLEALDAEAAQDAYEQALAADPAHAGAATNLGRLFHEDGRLDQAERVYRACLAACDGDALLHYNLGVLLEDAARPDEAAQSYERALSEDAGLADCHYNLTCLYQTQGRQKEAIRHLAQYRKLTGEDRGG